MQTSLKHYTYRNKMKTLFSLQQQLWAEGGGIKYWLQSGVKTYLQCLDIELGIMRRFSLLRRLLAVLQRVFILWGGGTQFTVHARSVTDDRRTDRQTDISVALSEQANSIVYGMYTSRDWWRSVSRPGMSTTQSCNIQLPTLLPTLHYYTGISLHAYLRTVCHQKWCLHSVYEHSQAWAHKIFIFRTEKIWNFRTFFRTSESQKTRFLSFLAHINLERLELRLK